MRGLSALRQAVPPAGHPALARLVGVGVAQALAAAVVALSVHRLFSGALSPQAVPALPLALLAAAVVLLIWLRFRERVEGERLGQTVAHEMRRRMAAHLVRLPGGAGRPAQGDVVLRFTGDLAMLRNWHAGGLAALVVGLPVLLGGLLGLALLDPVLAAALALLVILSLGAQSLIGPRLRAAGEEAGRRRSRLARGVADRVAALSSIQAFGQTGTETRRIEAQSAELTEAMIARAHAAGLMRASTEWAAAGLPLLILGVWVLTGQADPGAAFATLTIGGLIGPRIRELGRIREYRELARVSEDRIAAFLALPPLDDRAGAKALSRRAGGLILRDVGLKGVFSGLAAKADPGARIALTGPNGAGKSRLLGLIAGLEEPGAGTIVLDGQNAMGRSLASRRRLVALAGAAAPLVKGSVAANIRYGARLSGAEEEAALALGGHEALLAELKQGGATKVGAGGAGLSLGQQGRVALLRALLRDPVLLLLDEIDAHLDPAGQEVLERIFATFPGTILMATHSPHWTARCDAVWTLAGGRLTVAPAPEERTNRNA